MVRTLIAVLVSLAAVSASAAAEPYIGAWATKASDCGSEPLFTFSSNNVVGLTFACKRASFTKSAKGWKVAAKACSSEDPGESDQTFTIAIEAGKLQVLWDDGSTSDKLVKCTK